MTIKNRYVPIYKKKLYENTNIYTDTFTNIFASTFTNAFTNICKRRYLRTPLPDAAFALVGLCSRKICVKRCFKTCSYVRTPAIVSGCLNIYKIEANVKYANIYKISKI